MAFKVPGARTAYGYWGRDIRCRLEVDQTFGKIAALQMDQLLLGGLRARLWETVHPVQADTETLTGTLPCSCVKKSGEHADRRCYSCHGIGYVPGYTLFGYSNLYMASISPGLTTVGCQLNTSFKPHRWELAPDALTGTIVTSDIQYLRPLDAGGFWEERCDGAVRLPGATSMTCEVSLNAGATWQPLAVLASVNPGSGALRFRITLTRSALTDPSPLWEIVRARFPVVPVTGRLGPWILVLKTVNPQKLGQEPRGITVEGSGNKFWTKPLSFFNCRIPPQEGLTGAPDLANLIRDQSFIQFLDGVQESLVGFNRWSITDTTYDDPLGYFTRQMFSCRQQQDKEFTQLVF